MLCLVGNTGDCSLDAYEFSDPLTISEINSYALECNYEICYKLWTLIHGLEGFQDWPSNPLMLSIINHYCH
jgi:hypothetical protein